MDIKEMIKIFQDLLKKYRKKIFLLTIGIIGLFIFLFVTTSLFKMWDKATAVYYEISFRTNGGTIINPQKVRKGRALGDIVKTTKSGFDFKGWEYDGAMFDIEKTPVNEDMLLSAIWEPNGATVIHTVTFDSYGGTTTEPFIVSEGKTFTKPTDPIKEGYRFLGWYIGEDKYNFMKMAAPEDITLKAKWERIEPYDPDEKELERSASVFEQLSGTWYLKDYEDVYLTVTEEDNGFSEVWYFLKWYNIDLLNDFKLYSRKFYQRSFSSEKGEFYKKIDKFNCYLKDGKLIFEKDGNEYEFVREQGEKNRYTDTIYEKAVGRWYLENSYSSYVDIKQTKTNNVLDYDTYCITTTNINLGTLQLGSSMEYGCLKAYDDTLFKKLKMRFDGEVMTIDNENGRKRFTLDKVVSEGSVTGVKLDRVAAIIENGNKLVIYATVSPKEARNTKVIWESNDTNIVTVEPDPNIITTSAEGIRYAATLTAHNTGKATVTVRTVDGNHTATSVITVPDIAVNSVSLNKRETSIFVGNQEQLRASIVPSNASNQKLVWSSSNPDVASISETGNIRALKEGKTTITVSTEDGKKKATCVVTVKYMKLNVVTSLTKAVKIINGEYTDGISVIVTPSGGSGNYSSYQIRLYYNHDLVKTGTESTLFYPTTLSGSYYAEIIVTDSAGNTSTTTKDYILN